MIDQTVFEEHRPTLLGLAYRMLGSLGEAEDIVQEAWLRWRGRTAPVEAPRPYLMRTVTNLCLNARSSARARHEHYAGSQLPEPVGADEVARLGVEQTEAISMAFLVMLQQLSAAERAVLLLHQVFDHSHAEVAQMLGRTETSCRQLLRRARQHLRGERPRTRPSPNPNPDDHGRLLRAFVQATTTGTVDDLVDLLAEDAVLVADAGQHGARFGDVRNLPRPVQGARKVAAFLHAATRRGPADADIELRQVNGLPALVSRQGDDTLAVLAIDVVDGRIARVFIQADRQRLQRLERRLVAPA